MIAILVLAACLLAIFFRQRLGGLAPWKPMVAGAVACILFGAISPSAAFFAIDLRVMAFLFGMFLLAGGAVAVASTLVVWAWIAFVS